MRAERFDASPVMATRAMFGPIGSTHDTSTNSRHSRCGNCRLDSVAKRVFLLGWEIVSATQGVSLVSPASRSADPASVI